MQDASLVKTLAPIALLTLLRQVDAEDPSIRFTMRCIGFGLTVAIAGIMFVLRKRILKQKDGEMVISLRESDLEPPNPLAAMMSNPDEAAAEPSIQMTHVEFDMKKWNDEAKRLAMQACVVAGVHWKWQYLIPIIISPTMALVGVIGSELFQIHIQGRTAASHPSLKRPWTKAPAKSIFTEARSALMNTQEKKAKKKRNRKDE
ncbi:Phosphate transport (Pho88) [Plasmodiophora brassicae]